MRLRAEEKRSARGRQRDGVGMRLHSAEDKGKESACALRKKRRNWHARSAEGKEQELDVWRAEDKEWDRYALTRLSIPEDKVNGKSPATAQDDSALIDVGAPRRGGGGQRENL